MARSRRRPGHVPLRLQLLLAIGAGALAPGLVACGDPEPPRNAVVIVLDTLRADRLSAYGYPVKTSPVLDQLAEDGVLFQTVVSNASWTLPAMVGLLVGDFPTRSTFNGMLRQSLVQSIRTAGLRTAAFVEGGFVSAQYGLDRGFQNFHDGALEQEDGHSVGIETTFRGAEEWLRQNHDEPFFLLVHTYEPHTPYRRLDYARDLDSGALGETFEVLDAAKVRQKITPFGATERTYVRALYDGGVTASDRHVGQLLEVLEELGVRDETVIVVTSDHGEDIGGREPEWPGVHGQNLYDEQILVPLIIHDPTRDYPVKRVIPLVRTIDTLHSVVDILGLPPVTGKRGRSAVSMMTGEETRGREAWSKTHDMDYFGYQESYSVRTDFHKLILTPRSGEPGEAGEAETFDAELYDLAADPGERVDIHTVRPGRRARFQRRLLRLRDTLGADGVAEYQIRAKGKPRQKQVEERLRELGYIK